jgi:hypothetical protein
VPGVARGRVVVQHAQEALRLTFNVHFWCLIWPNLKSSTRKLWVAHQLDTKYHILSSAATAEHTGAVMFGFQYYVP